MRAKESTQGICHTEIDSWGKVALVINFWKNHNGRYSVAQYSSCESVCSFRQHILEVPSVFFHPVPKVGHRNIIWVFHKQISKASISKTAHSSFLSDLHFSWRKIILPSFSTFVSVKAGLLNLGPNISCIVCVWLVKLLLFYLGNHTLYFYGVVHIMQVF